MLDFFKKMDTKDTLLLVAGGPLAYLIGKGAEAAIEKTQSLAKDGSLTDLQEEATRQLIINQMAESQARVAQELAIAQRINTAEEVEIEEFYDASGKGNLGLNADLSKETIGVGVNGEGRKVTKRIYRFKGWHEGGTTVFEQLIKNDNK
jgi:hypothetical protein